MPKPIQIKVCQKCKRSKATKNRIEAWLKTRQVEGVVKDSKCLDECKKSPVVKVKGPQIKKTLKRLTPEKVDEKLEKALF